MLRPRLWLACAAMTTALVSAAPYTPALAAQASVTQHGYLTAPDGSSLSYTVVLPGAQGQFPVAMVYDGYSAGYAPMTDNGDAPIASALLAKGFAVMGVNVPGTGCSTGSVSPPFSQAWAKDGAAAVAWAASQPWSTGRVGMFGASFPGFMALYVAAERPRGLVAIAPTAWTGNFYDAVYPGGIYNDVFPNLFDADQLQGSVGDEQAAANNSDAQCELNFAQDQATRVPGQNGGPPLDYVAVQAPQHPYYDNEWSSLLWELKDAIPNIKVPVLTLNSYQDQIASASGMNYYSLLDPLQSWFILTNGWHAIGQSSNTWVDETVAFLDHFVAGADNGWQNTPKVQIWHEAYGTSSGDVEPQWTTTATSWPLQTTTSALYPSAGNLLSQGPPVSSEAPDSYRYPMPAGSTADAQDNLAGASAPSSNLWQLPVPPGGNVAYTTPPLSNDLDIVGPSSLNLWLSSTAPDTDVQVTISEVRPDGQEQYIQRGWLRISERKLGVGSTATWPRPTYQKADVHRLVPGVPTYARIPIYPFEHIFRSGSSIRISIEAPVGITATFAGFLFNPTPAKNSVWHDQGHVSEWVFNTLPITTAVPPAPACGSVLEEPCRTNTEPVPSSDTNG
ncbi:MAG TPA: CocE/NonD family hydrolase [Acidimicrobiales bacterium]|nr:CocE/NonD family hydrolase [Acidimicrobiales bacterium]